MATTLEDSMAVVMDAFPIMGNAAICSDSACTVGHAALNAYYSSNKLSRVLFIASGLCGLMGMASAGSSLASDIAGIPIAGCVGMVGARALNDLGKYTSHLGNIADGKIPEVENTTIPTIDNINITNPTDMSQFMI